MRATRYSLFVVGCLLASSCGQTTSTDAGAAGEHQSTDPTAVPSELGLEEPPADDNARFGEFPAEPSDSWLIGTEYVGTSFVESDTRTTLDAAATNVHFAGRNQISISSSECAIGGGHFTFVDGRVTEPELRRNLMMCTPSDRETYDAAQALIQSSPEIRVDGNRLLLLSDTHRLEMEAAEPGVLPLIGDNERFVAVDTTIPGVDPARIEVTSTAFFVIRVTVPTCEFWGSMTTEGNERSITMEPTTVHDPCEYSPQADKAAQSFFADGATAIRNDQTLEVTGRQGTLYFRLATTDDSPLPKQTPTPPPLAIPDQPDRTLPAEAGRISTPWYAERAGSTESGRADVPLPEEWEIQDPTGPTIGVTGRGYLTIKATQGPWDPETHSEMLGVIEGPTSLNVKLYRQEGDTIVESGTTATVQQYRYGSSDPGTWNRLVVWVLQRNDTTTIAEVGYPEFPEDSPFTSTGDPRNLALASLDAIDILNDVRFFE